MINSLSFLTCEKLFFLCCCHIEKKKIGAKANFTWIKSFLRSLSYVSNGHLIDKRHGNGTLKQMIWLWNHTFHTKVYFNEFVSKALHDHFLPQRLWRLLEAQTSYLDTHFGTLTQNSVHPTVPVLLTKDSRNEISYNFQPPYIHISCLLGICNFGKSPHSKSLTLSKVL